MLFLCSSDLIPLSLISICNNDVSDAFSGRSKRAKHRCQVTLIVRHRCSLRLSQKNDNTVAFTDYQRNSPAVDLYGMPHRQCVGHLSRFNVLTMLTS